MKHGEFYSLEDLFNKYGSREMVLELIAMGSIPDPWFEKALGFILDEILNE